MDGSLRAEFLEDSAFDSVWDSFLQLNFFFLKTGKWNLVITLVYSQTLTSLLYSGYLLSS